MTTNTRTPVVNPFDGNLQLIGSAGGGGGGGRSALTWKIQTADLTAVKGFGYFADSSNPGPTGLSVILPASSAVGDSFAVLNYNGNGFTIEMGSGQSINLGDRTTTTSSGSIISTQLGDVIELTCSVANLEWTATNYDGGLVVN